MFESKKLFKYLSTIIVGVFIILVAVQSGKYFTLDEADFPTVSNTTSQSGRPIYYHDEQAQHHTGTYHPTFYINSLATFIRIFGFNETTVRMFGAICVLLSAYLLVLIYRLLTTKKSGAAETLFLGLYLLNPYTIANATLPDIDPTVLPVMLLLFIYISLKYLLIKKAVGTKSVVILGLLFAAVLWTKLTTPLILPIFLGILAYIVSNDRVKSLLFSLKVTAIGVVVFVSSYFVYCLTLGLSLSYTYTFLWQSFAKGTSADGPIAGVMRNLGNLDHFLMWPTGLIVSLIGIASLAFILESSKDVKIRIIRLLVLMSLLTTIFYIALIAPFGGFFKYPFPVFGILVLSIVLFYDRYLSNVRPVNVAYLITAFIAGYAIEKYLLEDTMYIQGANNEFYLWLIPLVIAFGYVMLRYKKSRTMFSTAIMLILLFTLGFQFSISRIQATAPYPTKYLYGQTGMKEAAEYLRVVTKPDEPIWSMKDIGAYVHNRFYESYSAFFNKKYQDELISLLKSGKVRYYVATEGIGQDNITYYGDVRKILETHATKIKTYGNFVIYKSNNAKQD